MIEVYSSQYCIEIHGHARYDVPGRDIVCAAVSALICTLCIAMEKERCQGHLKQLESCSKSGFARVWAPPISAYEPRVALLFEAVLSGLEALAEEYSEYIKIFS